MSRFRYAAPELATLTDLPIFKEMAETGRAKPMRVGIHRVVTAAVSIRHPDDKDARRKANRALRVLTQSKRYLAACMEDGAARYSADGSPFAPVTNRQKAFANELNKKIAAHCGRKEEA